MNPILAALLRLGRVLVAQAISWAIAQYGGITLPWFPITVGAIISAVAKFLRDKYGMEWLPI